MSVIEMPSIPGQKWVPLVIVRDHPVVYVHKGRKHLWVVCGDASIGIKRSLFKLYGDFVFGTDSESQS